ncbi:MULTISPECIES: TetR/AcrR family transcriptional regulator [Actinoalloteichus]|uniref:Transcriptional regulator, TetR family n=1 Tax=Actinoalloteichus fjordicus TaxID=1612552 RepID=A0AAC9LAN1_9PSEU|nr:MULTISPECIES: TetR/AcrR family transcriptional regulator [Actinoalloteichus]APU13157.1 transcriptional regulator, TetR family [Actinoalloteichus fjordicus]APU19107.1 transcriptional regulator, TetR family [Actinoalloteichus sp. GBA129-24]
MPSTREVLLTAATRLIDEGGAGAVTLREVGRLAGVSHNAPYKHFAHKEALLAAVAARELEVYANLLEPQDGRSATLEGALEDYLDRAMRHPERFRLVYQRWTVVSDELGAAAAHATTALDALIAVGQREGRIPGDSPARPADLLRALTHGAIELTLTGHLGKRGDGRTPRDLVADLLELMGPSRT